MRVLQQFCIGWIPGGGHRHGLGLVLFGLAALPWLVHGKAPMASPGLLDLTLMVRSQDTSRDNALLQELEELVQTSQADAEMAGESFPNVRIVGMADAQQEFKHSGLWTYKPWIFQHERKEASAKRRIVGGQRWLVMLEPRTAIDVRALAGLLLEYDARDPYYIGRALRDKEMSIVHHYSLDPPYPLHHTGFAVSVGLARLLVQDLEKNPLGSNQQIEPVWELAQWIKQVGVSLTDRKNDFCAETLQQRAAGCATWIRPIPAAGISQARLLDPSKDMIIAVKTVGHFHRSRIPLIHDFWADSSPVPVLFLSNTGFAGPPSVSVVDLSAEFGDAVDPSKESTQQGSGHCSKMQAILQYLWRHHANKRWFIVTDDDTLLNVQQLITVLQSHDDRQRVYVGERYGWAHRETSQGSNYITTGGGMALSAPALQALAECSNCRCRSPNAPDDMTLGSWCGRLGIPILHEEGFHQSEPQNYHSELLSVSDPIVSFHRYSVRMPKSTPEEVVTEARRQSWRNWVETYFVKANHPATAEL